MLPQNMSLERSALIEQLGQRWASFLVIGIALTVLGIIAVMNSMSATFASVIFFGYMLVVGGIVHLGQSLRVRARNPGLFHGLLAMLYLFAGVLAITRPMESAISITLMFGVFLLLGGVVRAVFAVWARNPGSGWDLANGIISFLFGAMIIAGWPSSSFWLIGLFVGITLLTDGIALTTFALILRPKKRDGIMINPHGHGHSV